MTIEALPVVVIGAGAVGLAAAARLLERGLAPLVLEQGPNAGSTVSAWGHVRLFSPWRFNIDAAARGSKRSGGRHQRPNSFPPDTTWFAAISRRWPTILRSRPASSSERAWPR